MSRRATKAELQAENEALRSRLAEMEAALAACRRQGEAADGWGATADPLAVILRTVPTAVVVLDRDLMPMRENDAAARLFQWTAAEERLPWVQRIKGRDPRSATGEPVAVEDLPTARSRQGETVRDFILCLHNGAGEDLWLLVNSAPLCGPNGVITGSVTTYADITQVHRLTWDLEAADKESAALNEALQGANEQLRAANEELTAANEELRVASEELRVVHEALIGSEEMYRSLVEQIPFGLWMSDAGGRPTYLSPLLLEVLGLAGQPLNNDAYLERVHPADRDRWREAGERALRDRADFRLEYRVRGQDGLYRHLLALGRPRFGANGIFLGHIGLNLDITDRKLQEERIEALAENARLTAERLQTVFDALHDPLLVHGAAGDPVLVNPAAAAWLVTTEGTAAEVYAAARVRYPDGSEIPPEQTPIARMLRGETVGEEALLCDSKLGPDRRIVVSGSPLRQDGRVTGAVVTIHDITDLMQAQAQRDAVLLAQERETDFMRLLTEAPDTRSLVRQAGNMLCEWFGCDAFAVRWRRGDDFPYLTHGGLSEDLLAAEASLCRRDEHGRVVCDADGKAELECLCGAVLRGRTDPALPCFSPGGSLWTNDVQELLASTPQDRLPTRIRGLCVTEGFRSMARVPLRFQDSIYGLLQIDSKQPGRFSPEAIEFLERMARSLALRLAQHETQEALADSEGRYRTIGELLPYGTFVVDPTGRQLYLSPSFLELMGKDLDEVRKPSVWTSLQHPDEVAESHRLWQEAVRNRRFYSREYRILGQDGRYHWILCRGVPVLDENGEIEYWVGVNADIDELKQAEEALRRSEERLRRAQEIAHLGSWELDLTTDELTWSDEVYRIFGLQPQEFEATYEGFLERVHPDDRAAVDEAYMGSVRENRDGYEIEHRVVRAHTGEIRVVHERCEHFRNEAGAIVRSVGMVHDITERKAAETRIAHLASFPEKNPNPVLEVSTQGEVRYANPTAQRILAGADPARWLPEDFARSASELMASGARLVYEVQIGAETFLTTLAPMPEFGTMRVYAIDITKRKRAEADRERLLAQVQAERERLFSVLSMFPAYVCLLTPEYECAFANRRFTELFGEGRPGQKCYNLLFGRNDPCEGCQSYDCLTDDTPRVWEWTSPMNTCFEVYDYPFIDTDGTKMVLEVGFEITERKQAQEELQAHRDRLEELVRERTAEVQERSRVLESVFNNSLSCLVLLDLEFNFIRVNEAYARACGRPVEDFAGHNHFVDYPSADLKAIFEEVVRTKQPWTATSRPFEFPDHPEWGTTYWDLSVVPILDSQGETEMLLFSLQDVTARAQAAQQLREYQESLRSLAMELTRAEEQQRRRIATVIHDDVTQNLAFAKMKTALIRRSEDMATVRRELEPLETALDEAIRNARSLTFEVSPPILYEIGFEPALEWLVEQMSGRHGYQARLEADPQERRLSQDVQITLFQAVRELLTNVAKHAQAQHVTVSVRGQGDFVEVVVSDDGVGFADLGGHSGFGLFNIQERLSYLGGKLQMEGRPGEGARFILRAPLQQE